MIRDEEGKGKCSLLTEVVEEQRECRDSTWTDKKSCQSMKN